VKDRRNYVSLCSEQFAVAATKPQRQPTVPKSPPRSRVPSRTSVEHFRGRTDGDVQGQPRIGSTKRDSLGQIVGVGSWHRRMKRRTGRGRLLCDENSINEPGEGEAIQLQRHVKNEKTEIGVDMKMTVI